MSNVNYDATNWKNNETPVNATNMNNIEQGLVRTIAALSDIDFTQEDRQILTGLKGKGSTQNPIYFDSDGIAKLVTSLPVNIGGTGSTSFTAGQVLIGNGTNPVTTRQISNPTSVSHASASINLITANALVNWDGSYDSSHQSNIEYVKKGKLGTASIAEVSTSGVSANGNKLVTEAQVKSWVESKGYITSAADTKNTAGSTQDTSKLFLVGAKSQADNPQTFSNSGVYVGTDGHVYSHSKQVVNLSDSQTLSNKTITNSTYNGYTLGDACAKGVDNTTGGTQGSTNLITSGAVKETAKTIITNISFPSAGVLRYTKNGVATDLPFSSSTQAYHIGTTPPSSTNLMWIDSGNGYCLKVYNGTSWVTTRAVWS